ncbi:luciferin 4-monooxygenase-like isoform X2 [Bacillus rossius redtenbacheri]|uniref:luciferin 4-monooxygenase-like isoform X2 n=1 Tax=Bacillus rossius redtenbacheri TaxID=93214 RepID=UPI002FDD54FB
MTPPRLHPPPFNFSRLASLDNNGVAFVCCWISVAMPSPIVRGPPRLAVQDTSLGEKLYRNLLEQGDKTVMVDGLTRREMTARRLLELSSRLAEGLRARGVLPGDTVAVCSENSLEYCLPVLAALYLGAVCAPLNATYTPRELQHALGLSRPKAVFCSRLTEDAVREAVEAVKAAGAEPLVAVLDGDPGLLPLAAAVGVSPGFAPRPVPRPEDQVAFVMCSSGTTGLPKGVLITHANMLYCNALRRYDKIRGPSDVDKVLAYLPMSHALGITMLTACLEEGVLLIVMPSFQPDLFLQLIQDYKVEYVPLVPPLVAFLAKHPMVADYDLSSLRRVSCGAAPLSADLLRQFLARFPHVQHVTQGYGLTECTLGAVFTPFGSDNHASVGTVVPGMELKIADPETGAALEAGRRGEICFRGPLVMKGYAGDPRATAQAVDGDGWLRTGDVGFLDQQGFLYVVDRIKELIKYQGFQVPPAELEAILMSHPAVMDAAVVGVPDARAGELPRAFVVKKKDVSERELVDFVAKQVSPPKRLRGGVQFVDSIPKNPSGKILRREVKELYLPNSKL